MMILGDKRSEFIDRLNLSDALRKLTNGAFVHEELEFECEKLRYSMEQVDFSPTGLNVVPLWESESSITGFYLEPDNSPVFIH